MVPTKYRRSFDIGDRVVIDCKGSSYFHKRVGTITNKKESRYNPDKDSYEILIDGEARTSNGNEDVFLPINSIYANELIDRMVVS